MGGFPQKINILFKIAVLVLIALSIVGEVYVFNKLKLIDVQISWLTDQAKVNSFQDTMDVPKGTTNPVPLATDSCGSTCKAEIDRRISEALANTTGSTKTIVQKQVIPSSQTVYIPLAGSVTTTSTDWTDVPGTEIYIDLVKDYGSTAKVSWEASLSIAHANGTVYARLYDSTHGIGVAGSDVSVTDKATLTSVNSGYLGLWAGRNLYKVQIKSLNTFEANFGSGRIKISY